MEKLDNAAEEIMMMFFSLLYREALNIEKAISGNDPQPRKGVIICTVGYSGGLKEKELINAMKDYPVYKSERTIKDEINRLIKDGLLDVKIAIETNCSGRERRTNYLYLTKKGQESFQTMRTLGKEFIKNNILTRLEESKIDTFISCLKNIANR